MTTRSQTHLVLIPSYNTGSKVLDVVREACRQWHPVWVVVDGSTDGTAQSLLELATREAALRVLVLPVNQGKGAAICAGLEAARAAGFTHALAMDADGQHLAAQIPEFMAISMENRDAMVLGLPLFGPEAPRVRVYGRRICNWWTSVETLGQGIGDSLFGYRVYPVVPLTDIMRRCRWMRRFDFDAEAAVRLCWDGVRIINLPSPVAYYRADQGGVSHFRYLRDNALLTWMHLRLLVDFLVHLPLLLTNWLGRRRAQVISSHR